MENYSSSVQLQPQRTGKNVAMGIINLVPRSPLGFNRYTDFPIRLLHEANSPTSCPSSSNDSHIFRPLQFNKATANNGKIDQQYFALHVRLHALVVRPGKGGLKWIEIARQTSPPLVVGHHPRRSHKKSEAAIHTLQGVTFGQEVEFDARSPLSDLE